eukprot:354470-Chlamydomonas_euryale.AAC.2
MVHSLSSPTRHDALAYITYLAEGVGGGRWRHEPSSTPTPASRSSAGGWRQVRQRPPTPAGEVGASSSMHMSWRSHGPALAQAHARTGPRSF